MFAVTLVSIHVVFIFTVAIQIDEIRIQLLDFIKENTDKI